MRVCVRVCVCARAAGIGVSGSSHWELMCLCAHAAGIGVSGSSH